MNLKEQTDQQLLALIDGLNQELDSRLHIANHPPVSESGTNKGYKKKALKLMEDAQELEGEYDLEFTLPISIKVKLELAPWLKNTPYLEHFLLGKIDENYNMVASIFNVNYEVMIKDAKIPKKKIWEECLLNCFSTNELIELMGEARTKVMAVVNKSKKLASTLTPTDKTFLKNNENFLK